MALVLVWLALTGSFNAWQTGPLLAMNGFVSLGLVAGVIYQFRPKPLTWPLLALWLVLAFSTALNNPAGWGKLYYWLVLIAVYHLPQRAGERQRAAVWAGWVLFPLAILLPWENGNSMAFMVVPLLWLGGERAGPRWLTLGVVALLASGSTGGLLAGVVGLAVYAWQRWPPDKKTAGLAGLVLAVLLAGLIAGQANNSGSWANRVAIYRHALVGISQAPLAGHGADSFSLTVAGWPALDEHNLILTTAHESGLIGLAVAGWLVSWLVMRHTFNPWQAGLLTSVAVHSMVDGPLFGSFFTGVVVMMVLGGLPCKASITWAWRWPGRWPWPRSGPI